jgi:RNA polymerase-binding transcription factor
MVLPETLASFHLRNGSRRCATGFGPNLASDRCMKKTEEKRLQTLRELLSHLRNESLARIRQYRQEQDEAFTPAPADALDMARSLAEVETEAGLIERAEYRLKAIEAALSRLERGRYGKCEDCGLNIPLERLRALPFATRCVDCQAKRNRARGVGEGTIDEPFRRTWEVPQEADESFEKGDRMSSPEENIPVRDQTSFGPEIGEFEQMPPTGTARRRGRVRKKEKQETD